MPGQSETTAFIAWFQSDDRNGSRLKVSKEEVWLFITFTLIPLLGQTSNEKKFCREIIK